MTMQRIHVRMLLSTLILVAGACATDGSGGGSGGRDSIAAGSVEDSLSACLSRIPSDASEGQRMIAEESCERDQANRK